MNHQIPLTEDNFVTGGGAASKGTLHQRIKYDAFIIVFEANFLGHAAMKYYNFCKRYKYCVGHSVA
jgi:hypothetical protein